MMWKKSLALLLVLLLMLPAWAAVAASKDSKTVAVYLEGVVFEEFDDNEIKEITSQLNSLRKKNKLSDLQMNEQLMETAELRAEELSIYASKTRPNNKDCLTAFPEGLAAMDENRAAHPDFDSIESVMKYWKDSKVSKDRILNKKFTSFGIGHVICNNTHYWVLCLSSDVPESARSRKLITKSHAIEISPDLVEKKKLIFDKQTLQVGDTVPLKVFFTMKESWAGGTDVYFEYKPYSDDDIQWVSSNKEAVKVSFNTDYQTATAEALTTGKSTLSLTLFGKKVSAVFTVSGVNKITNDSGIYSLNNKKHTATLTGVEKNSLTALAIPDEISANGTTYKVTAIAKNACKDLKKLKSLTIGKNVTSIGANAFSGCAKLKAITLKTASLKSVGKDAFASISSKATIKCPSGKLEAYRKLLRKKGLPNSVNFSK